jgi:hypothetical protein
MIERNTISTKDIANRTHQLYVGRERGREPGADVEDWVRPEKQLSSEAGSRTVKSKTVRAGHE